MGSKLSTVLLIAMAAATGPAVAETNDSVSLSESSTRDLEQIKQAAGPQRVPTVNDLTQIHADTLIMQAQNALAEESRRYSANNQDGAKAAAPPPARERIPVVARVVGQAGAPTAYLLLGDGSVVAAQKGATVPGGYTVVDVTARQVRVGANGYTFALGFAVTTPNLGGGQGVRALNNDG